MTKLSKLGTWRRYRCLSQSQLAELAGTTQPHISRLEAGSQQARPDTARKLAWALGVSPEMLVESPVGMDDGIVSGPVGSTEVVK